MGTISKIREKFSNNRWQIEDSYGHSTFGRYCSMMEGLRYPQEQNLILELTDRFLKLDFDEYEAYLLYSVKNLFQDTPNSNMHIVPMLAAKDTGKVKSSMLITYRFKGDRMKTLSAYNGQVLKVYDSIDTLPKELDEGDIVLLVDDFIGTGETANNAIKYLMDINSNVTTTQILILSLVSLKTGIDLIESNGIKTYSSVILGKGISDYYTQPKKINYLSIIKNIENRIKVSEKFQLGYMQSEALVSMIRTPNNTFPIFWKNNNTAVAPFPR